MTASHSHVISHTYDFEILLRHIGRPFQQAAREGQRKLPTSLLESSLAQKRLHITGSFYLQQTGKCMTFVRMTSVRMISPPFSNPSDFLMYVQRFSTGMARRIHFSECPAFLGGEIQNE